MKLARLNHILVPPTKERRDRLRRGWLGRVLRPAAWLYGAFSAEGRALAVLVPFLGFVALEVYGTRVYLLWSAVVGLLVAGLLVRRAYRLDGVAIEVAVPRRVTVGEPVRFGLTIRNDGDRDQLALRVAGPFLPWDGRFLGPLPVFPRVPAGATAHGEATARFVERGEHHLDPFSVAALVPLGLVVGPPVVGAGCRFVVVPRVAPVDRIELPVGDRYQPGGVQQASRTGEARELWGVRPYRRGDAVRDLHALTWARTGIPHVREYRQEYFSRVGVIVDNDGRAGSEDGLEAVISLAAGVVGCLSRGEALIDLLVVDGRVHQLTLGRSLGFLEQALELLACVRPGVPLDAAGLGRRLAPYLAQLSAVVLITEASIEAGPAGRERRALLERLEADGVPCRVLRVARKPRRVVPAGPHEQVVSWAAIAGEEPLRL